MEPGYEKTSCRAHDCTSNDIGQVMFVRGNAQITGSGGEGDSRAPNPGGGSVSFEARNRSCRHGRDEPEHGVS